MTRLEVAMRTIALISSILLLPLAGGASAAEPDRYRLEKTPNGYVRMDTRTGQMSICQEKWGELVCKIAADERTAVQDEIERLQTEMKALEDRLGSVKALEGRVAKLENSLTAKIEQSLPTEEDFNRTMGYMERFFRSFMAIVKDFENEDSKPAEPGTDRT
jgi:predicted nuclease with TOPRIM domain